MMIIFEKVVLGKRRNVLYWFFSWHFCAHPVTRSCIGQDPKSRIAKSS